MSRGSSASSSFQTVCYCGATLAIKQSNTQENPYRRFYACKFYDSVTKTRRCKYFRWVDETQTTWQRDVINQLKSGQIRQCGCYASSKNVMEEEMRKLKQENEQLLEQLKTISSDVNPKMTKCSFCVVVL